MTVLSHDGSNPVSGTRRLGVVIGGSLTKGLEVRLDGDVSVEEMAVGRYVTVFGENQRYCGLITDVELRSISPSLVNLAIDADPFTRQVVSGTATYGVLHVVPYLKLGTLNGATPEPVKTVPPHFAAVYEASQEDVASIFGTEGPSHFVIGSPLDMDVKVCLSYERFIERSNGVFGKSGTGKTFLTRLLLASVIQRSNAQADRSRKCVNLVFDMHNEYGWAGRSEGPGGTVKSLKQVLGASVAVFTLDEESSRRRRVSADSVIEIGWEDVEPEDISVLRETLNLTPLAVEASFALKRRYGKDWLGAALALSSSDDQTRDILKDLSIADGSWMNLRRGLDKLVDLKFMRKGSSYNSLKSILENLLGGRNVVLEFGRYESNLAAYMLVANILTRRIHDEYRRRVEEAMGDRTQEPYHLIITIEEAHKFLSREVASQAIFGQIAREMRKYNVTLLVIDQRPSAIDEEVMSQIGTKITCLLDNDKDVEAVLAGVSGKGELRSVLARLDSRQQALIFGHAVPMPVVVRTEEWGSDESYRRFSQGQIGSLTQRLTSSGHPADDLHPPRR